MKIMITILGILIVLVGILPLIGETGMNILPSAIPTSGAGYSALIILIGSIGVIYGITNKMVSGIEKIVTVIIGLLTILGGCIPFIVSFLPVSIPTSGPFYSGMLILIGGLGIVYGVMSL